MNRSLTTFTFTFAVATLAAAGCATAPATEAPIATLDCAAIEAELAHSAEAQRNAARQQQDAWKAIVPFAVMARYGQGKAAAQESEQRAAKLQQHAALHGCVLSR